jgi:hypothetical protein
LPVGCSDAVFRNIAVDLPSFRFGQRCPLDLYGRMQNGLFRFLFRFSRGSELHQAPAHFIVRTELTGVGLANPLLDQSDVVLVQREILIDGFIQDEAAVALLEGGEGIEGFDFVAGGAEGHCLLLHASRIQRITAKYQSAAWADSCPKARTVPSAAGL